MDANLVPVWVSTKDARDADFASRQLCHFPRVPVIGDHLTFGFQETKYQVTLVMLMPFEGADASAEIFAVAVDDKQMMAAAS